MRRLYLKQIKSSVFPLERTKTEDEQDQTFRFDKVSILDTLSAFRVSLPVLDHCTLLQRVQWFYALLSRSIMARSRRWLWQNTEWTGHGQSTLKGTDQDYDNKYASKTSKKTRNEKHNCNWYYSGYRSMYSSAIRRSRLCRGEIRKCA